MDNKGLITSRKFGHGIKKIHKKAKQAKTFKKMQKILKKCRKKWKKWKNLKTMQNSSKIYFKKSKNSNNLLKNLKFILRISQRFYPVMEANSNNNHMITQYKYIIHFFFRKRIFVFILFLYVLVQIFLNSGFVLHYGTVDDCFFFLIC